MTPIWSAVAGAAGNDVDRGTRRREEDAANDRVARGFAFALAFFIAGVITRSELTM
jgi:hypothetical protein